jgi:hypothetical protein
MCCFAAAACLLACGGRLLLCARTSLRLAAADLTIFPPPHTLQVADHYDLAQSALELINPSIHSPHASLHRGETVRLPCEGELRQPPHHAARFTTAAPRQAFPQPAGGLLQCLCCQGAGCGASPNPPCSRRQERQLHL